MYNLFSISLLILINIFKIKSVLKFFFNNILSAWIKYCETATFSLDSRGIFIIYTSRSRQNWTYGMPHKAIKETNICNFGMLDKNAQSTMVNWHYYVANLRRPHFILPSYHYNLILFHTYIYIYIYTSIPSPPLSSWGDRWRDLI